MSTAEVLQKAIAKKQDAYEKALGLLTADADSEEADRAKWELREALELVRCLRRLLDGRSRDEIYRAFGAPGDFGYHRPIGDALAAIYHAPASKVAAPPSEASSKADAWKELAEGLFGGPIAWPDGASGPTDPRPSLPTGGGDYDDPPTWQELWDLKDPRGGESAQVEIEALRFELGAARAREAELREALGELADSAEHAAGEAAPPDDGSIEGTWGELRANVDKARAALAFTPDDQVEGQSVAIEALRRIAGFSTAPGGGRLTGLNDPGFVAAEALLGMASPLSPAIAQVASLVSACAAGLAGAKPGTHPPRSRRDLIADAALAIARADALDAEEAKASAKDGAK